MLVPCDLHIHSALSPCADRTMTPGNIVGMARLKGLRLIAITDHQSCGNCGPAMHMAGQSGDLLVLPGLEVESAEEIHLICLFADLMSARHFEADIRAHLPARPNRPDIFGEQQYYADDDQPAGTEPVLLLQPASLDCFQVAACVAASGGVCIPAHVDRPSYSMLRTLGSIPPEFAGSWIELSSGADEPSLLAASPGLRTHPWLRTSDAHQLGDILEPGFLLDVPVFSFSASGRQNVIEALRPLLYQ